MDYSLLIARFLGVVFVVYGLALIVNGRKFSMAVKAAKNCAGLSWLIGVCQLFWGSLLIVTQEVWMGWMVLVTVAGWVIFLMGVFRLWCCRCNSTCTSDNKCDVEGGGNCKSSCFMMIGLIVLIWGAAMIYYGFFGGDMSNMMSLVHHVGQ